MNRAPSARDRWWSKRCIRVFSHLQRCSSFMSGEHERRCGGTFEKIKEPADYKAKENRKRTTAETPSDLQATSTQSRYEWVDVGTVNLVLTMILSSLSCQRRRSKKRRAMKFLVTAPSINFSRKRIQSLRRAMSNERIDNDLARRAHRQDHQRRRRSRTKPKQTMPIVPHAMFFYPRLIYLFTKYDAISSCGAVDFLLLSHVYCSHRFSFVGTDQVNYSQ